MRVTLYNNLTDEQLVTLSQDGDKQAFGEIVERYKGVVARTVKGMLGDDAFAEDIGQEAFVKLFFSLKDFRGEAKISTYLNRIAVNLTLNEIKKRKNSRGTTVPAEAGSMITERMGDDYYERSETQELVNKSLSLLEPKFRIVVVMRLMEGYSTKETAEILDIPEGTVLSRLSRAQDQLRKILSRL